MVKRDILLLLMEMCIRDRSKTGEVKKYLVNMSKQILVQENDYVRAGTPLSDGAITPADILEMCIRDRICFLKKSIWISWIHFLKKTNIWKIQIRISL